jgi:hypothetical protein
MPRAAIASSVRRRRASNSSQSKCSAIVASALRRAPAGQPRSGSSGLRSSATLPQLAELKRFRVLARPNLPDVRHH